MLKNLGTEQTNFFNKTKITCINPRESIELPDI